MFLAASDVKHDANLPPELKKLMFPLNCELCDVKFNSPVTAKIHYESRAHEKKVKPWLEEWAKKTGNPLPQLVSVSIG